MAETKPIDIKLLKRTQISVHVEEALPDLLVVSYELGVKIYKGVLLESTKRNLPCGIQSLHPAFTKTDTDDPLYAVNQRFAYIDPKAAPHTLSKKNAYIPAKHKHSKMTVRLRPRQVLCSKCKGICNENNENVGRKRKAGIDADSGNHTVPAKRSANAPVTRSSVAIVTSAENKVRFELRSRQTLLSPPQSSSVVTRASNVEDKITKVISGVKESDCGVPSIVLDAVVVPKKSDLRSARRTQRRKPTEDLQVSNEHNDEGKNNNNRSQSNANSSYVTNEISSSNSNSSSSTCSSTRTIKICYGPQGEGTVLKIPAQIDHLQVNAIDEKEIDVLNEVPIEVDPIGHISDRATRKALKKAKKEARKRPNTPPFTNILASGNTATTSTALTASDAATFPPPLPPYHTSQHYHQQQQLPHATTGAVSPARYTLGADVGGNASPKHGSGCASTPRAIVEGASAGDKLDTTTELSGPSSGGRRRKHKVKHKKRHREDRERKSVDNEDDSSQCSTQKLSINLKRLNDTYCATTIPFLPIDESSASSDEPIPDFPPNDTQESNPNITKNTTTKDADGSVLCTGDVVWGKMQGFPWWPAKVIAITDSSMTDGSDDAPTVNVSWYGSDTSSVLPSHYLSNYLQNYKIRYNKKKRGPYKEAIRLATVEARTNADRPPIVTPFLPTADNGNTFDTPMFSYRQSSYSAGGDTLSDPPTAHTQPLDASPSHSNTASPTPLLTAVRPALASPREINVIS